MSFATLTGSGVTPNNTVTLRAGANATITISLRDASNKPFANYIANYTSIIVADTERGLTISMDRWLVSGAAAFAAATATARHAASCTALHIHSCTLAVAQVDRGSGNLTSLLTTTEALNGRGMGLTTTNVISPSVYKLVVEYPQNSGNSLRVGRLSGHAPCWPCCWRPDKAGCWRGES